MYDPKQTKELQKKTGEWLSLAKDPEHGDVNKKNAEALRNCLRFHKKLKKKTRTASPKIPRHKG